jgi:hypothetical protein
MVRSIISFLSNHTHPKYIQYAGWSFVSNMFVSAESAISTNSMLHVIGTYDETIRTANYIGKDIIGQIGGLLYMSKMSKQSDKNPHTFLLYSNILQQFAYISMCSTPMMPDYFLPVAGFSNILLNISFISFGAINAKCIQNLANNNNTGEIYSNISIVNTLGSSFGLLLGIGIVGLIPDHATRMCIIPMFALGRIISFNKAIQSIV